MLNKDNISKLILNLNDDINLNLKKIKKYFGKLDYFDHENQSLLHILVDNKYDESKTFYAIRSLLKAGISPNLKSDFDYNFIQTALYTGYSEEFILKIINESLKYGLDVNHVDEDKDTMVYTAIYSDNYLGEIENIYELLSQHGYDSKKLDKEGKNLPEAMIAQGYYTEEQIEYFKLSYDSYLLGEAKTIEEKVETLKKCVNKEEIPTQKITPMQQRDYSKYEKYGKVLNKKNYITSPTIGREQELKNLIVTLAQDKKQSLIIGESGVGKTALGEELAYRIKIGQVPNFLQNKVILEVNPNELVAGCQYVGQFEEKISELLKLCEKEEIILFIDEIHTIYGVGTTRKNDNDMAGMIKQYIEKTDLQVIGTTTEKEYSEYFSNDALKRRFELITVKEPNEEILYQIIDKVISDYSTKTGLLFENEEIKKYISKVIIESTTKKCRKYNDIINNPDLSISIIDKAFAFAKVYDSDLINVDHFIESFKTCSRIYDSVKELAIAKLEKINIKPKEQKQTKILKIDFYRREK